MPLTPEEHQWITRIDKEVGQLFALGNQDEKETDQIRFRLDTVAAKNKSLWGFVLLLAGGLAGGAMGGVAFYMQKLGGIEAKLDNAAKETESLRSEIKELAKQLREHEIRASVARPEPAK